MSNTRARTKKKASNPNFGKNPRIRTDRKRIETTPNKTKWIKQ